MRESFQAVEAKKKKFQYHGVSVNRRFPCQPTSSPSHFSISAKFDIIRAYVVHKFKHSACIYIGHAYMYTSTFSSSRVSVINSPRTSRRFLGLVWPPIRVTGNLSTS